MSAAEAEDDAGEKLTLLDTGTSSSGEKDTCSDSTPGSAADVATKAASSPDGDNFGVTMDAAAVLPPRALLPPGWRGNIRWLVAALGFSMELVCYADRTNLALALAPIGRYPIVTALGEQPHCRV